MSQTGRIFEPAHHGVDETTGMIRGENPESFRGRVLELCLEYPWCRSRRPLPWPEPLHRVLEAVRHRERERAPRLGVDESELNGEDETLRRVARDRHRQRERSLGPGRVARRRRRDRFDLNRRAEEAVRRTESSTGRYPTAWNPDLVVGF